MARYNSQFTVNSVSSAVSSPLIPQQGVLTEFTASAPYTVQLPNPVLFPGFSMSFYNASTYTITLSTTATSGIITGPGTSVANTCALGSLNSAVFVSDGTNWVATAFSGGAGAFTTLTASSTVNFNMANATITMSPTGTGSVTINPATAGNINNMAVGQTTAAAGSFTTLSASSTVSGTGFSTYLASPPAIGGTSAAAGTFTTLTINNVLTATCIQEVLGVNSSPGGSPALSFTTSDVWYLTSLSANFVPNFTNVPTTAGRTTTLTLILVQGGTPYYPTSVQINGTGYSITWAGGSAPTPRASKVEFATFIVTNPSGSFTYVLGQYGSFG
jgi:hypothetical protein